MSTRNAIVENRSTKSISKQCEIYENPFNNNVLVGNWFEERFGDKNDRKAIAPGICGQSDCCNEKSMYASDFTQQVPSDSRTDIIDFMHWKQRGFSNRLNGEMSNIKLWNGSQFEKNFTTMKDVMYHIVPMKQRKSQEFALLKKAQHEDFMRSFGNSTKTGLMQWQACEQWKEQNTPSDMSHYKNEFKMLPLDPNRRLCKGPQRKTSIV